MNINAQKYYDCYKLLYNMDEKDLESEQADKIRDEADVCWKSLTEADRDELRQKIISELKNE